MGKFSGLQNLSTKIADLDGETSLSRSNPSFEITSNSPIEKPSTLLVVPLSEIIVGNRIRQYLDTEKTESLAHSIRQHGFRGVLWVRRIQNQYYLVAGGRRYAACQIAGITEVFIEIWDVTDAEALQLELLENFQRENLNPIEEVEGVLRMLEVTLELERTEVIALLRRKGRFDGDVETGDNVAPTSGSSHNKRFALSKQVCDVEVFKQIDEVFSLIGKYNAESFRTHRLPLLNLPYHLREAVGSGELEYTKARTISRIKDGDMQENVLKQVLNEGLSHIEISNLVKRIKEDSQVNSDLSPEREVYSRVQTVAKRFRSTKLDGRALKKAENLLEQLEALLNQS